MNAMKILYIFLGTFSLGIGLAGILIPGLPATPFFLLTAGLYMRSSERLYNKLISNKIIGPYITDFTNNRGMTRQAKIVSVSIMWTMIGISCYALNSIPVIIIMILLGVTGTVVMTFMIRTTHR